MNSDGRPGVPKAMRRLRYVVPLLAALGLALWLLLAGGTSGNREPAPKSNGSAADHAASLLSAGEGRAPGEDAPALATRDREQKPGQELHEVRVFVYGPNGPRASAPLRIRDPRNTPPVRWVLTPPDSGLFKLRGVPLDGTVLVEAMDRPPSQAGVPRVLDSERVTEPREELFCKPWLPCEMRFEDAESGTRVRGVAWRIQTRVYRHETDSSSKPVQSMPVDPGQYAEPYVEISGEPSPRHVRWRERAWTRAVSRYATSAYAVPPLRRHARVHVRAVEHDGTPSDRAHVLAFAVGGRAVKQGVRAIPDRGGFMVRGIPFFRERPVEVLVTRPLEPGVRPSEEIDIEFEVDEVEDEEADDSFEFRETLTDAAVGRGRLPPAWHRLLVLTARFPEDPKKEIEWGSPRAHGIVVDWGISDVESPNQAKADVEVTALKRDGTPAAAATVVTSGGWGITDLQGRVRIEKVWTGERTFELRAPGIVRTIVKANVRAESANKVTLREAAGSTLRVCVEDEAGDGLPYATIGWPGNVSWVDLKDGVQRLDRFTDRLGRRTLERFPAGTWTLNATWADLHGHAKVKVEDGKSAELTITLVEKKD